jgi:hypothetical protein
VAPPPLLRPPPGVGWGGWGGGRGARSLAQAASIMIYLATLCLNQLPLVCCFCFRAGLWGAGAWVGRRCARPGRVVGRPLRGARAGPAGGMALPTPGGQDRQAASRLYLTLRCYALTSFLVARRIPMERPTSTIFLKLCRAMRSSTVSGRPAVFLMNRGSPRAIFINQL